MIVLMKTYPGGKGLSFRHIINLIPPHKVYIETHLGGGAVLRHKREAEKTIGIDLDVAVIERWKKIENNVELYNIHAHDFLKSYNFCGDEFVYCDPPYLPETRRRAHIYRVEYSWTEHQELLQIIKTLPCQVMISGYDNTLYQDYLSGWSKRVFTAQTQAGLVTESVWFNYKPPKILHDYRYIGEDFREREKIRRRMDNLKKKITALPEIERQAILRWGLEAFAITEPREAR